MKSYPLHSRSAPHDLERPLGDENPTLDLDYVGFVNGDTSATIDQQPTISTTATAESDPGTYPITLSNASDANYTITLANGTLTVLEPGVLPLPELLILREGNEITLTWDNRDDLRLEQADTLLEWTPISEGIGIGQTITTWIGMLPEEAATAPLQFYRLVRLP